jgi:hypothetical protein
VTVEVAKTLKLRKKEIILAQRHDVSWLLNGLGSKLSQNVLQEGVLSDFSKDLYNSLPACSQPLFCIRGSSVLTKVCDFWKTNCATEETTRAPSKCI